jgi:hypothetical protein
LEDIRGVIVEIDLNPLVLIDVDTTVALSARSRCAAGAEVAMVHAATVNDAALRAYLEGVPETPLEEGLRKTLEMFERDEPG